MGTTEPIAIVGMAGRFPGAADVDEFWANLVVGRDCLTELSDEELLRYQESPQAIAASSYVRKRPVLPDSDQFDHRLFGMTPRETELRDPQYRVMLESVHAALEHAGYDPARYPGRIGLFAGTNVNRYRYDHIERRPDVVSKVGFLAVDVGNHADYMATYISYRLGLRGPAMTLLSACSSSLVAVHVACTAIRAGDCDMAAAGGVDLEFPYHRGYHYLEGGILARDGTVRAFDAHATGTNFGDGVGAVLLKPLDAAVRDGDTVYSVILASAINNDGNRKVGYTAPSVAGQSECIGRALRDSGVHPRDIGYVEAHGTATRVGDPIELAGLTEAFQSVSPEPLPSQYCAITSVKSNIGHLGQAAGIAALIKATLVLTHRQVPPSINVQTPNPEVDWANSPFFVNTKLTDWESPGERPRYAGVSSFGIGGTNAHMVLREPPPVEAAVPGRAREIVLWSAVDGQAAEALRQRLAGHVGRVPAGDFPHLAYTLRVGRTHRALRGAVLAEDPATAAAALADPDRVLRADGESRSVVFAFPGQGAQLPGMYHDLYDGEPLFRRGCDAAFDVLAPLLGQDLRAVWRQADDPQRLAPTEVAQPLLYVLETTLAHCLLHWGVTPEVLIGHSVGELVAAAVAGVFDFEAGLRAVAARARCLREMPPGRMLAVPAGEAELAGLLPDTVVVAAVNAPDRLVVAGTAEAIDEVAAALRDRGHTGRILNTSHAFHSPVVADAVPAFAAALRELPLNPPAIPVISAATGAVLTAEQACSPTFWAEQIGQPVRFDRAAQALFAGGPATVLEVGPGHTLTRLLRAREDARTTRSRVHATTSRDGRASTVDEVLARLWVDGAAVDFARVDQGRGYRRVAAPGYPYQRRRFWLEPAAAEPPAEAPPAPAAAPQSRPAADAAPAPAQPTPPVAGAAPAPSGAAWRLAELDWVRDRDPLPPPAPGPATGAAVLLAPRDPAVARQVVTGLQRAGYRTVRAVPGGEFDPTGPAGWQRLLDSAAGRGTNGLVLAHAGLLEAPYQVGRDSLEEQLGAGLDAVHGAIQAAAAIHRQHRLPVRLVILGRGLVNVTGSEPVNPASASVTGLLRTAEREVAGLTGQVVDVAGEIDADQLASVLAGPALPVVALRGGCRWLPRLATLRDADQPPRLRSKGTYLITGGLGGIGLVIARTLAETGLCPRIALLGRTGPDGRDPAARDLLERTLAGLVEAGAQVETFAVDVAEVPALDRVVSTVEDRFGTVHGVVHAAGLAGGGLVERRDRADMRAVLRPKAAGILAIEEVFARRPALDFLALFSSQAGLAGLYGSADYAAANAFLDAYASRPGQAARRTLSVQWPGWAEVGMLAGSPTAAKVLGGQGAPDGGTRVNGGGPRDHAAERTVLEVIRTPGEDWEFDEHLFRDVPVLPGTALVELAVLAARATGVPATGWPIELRDMVFFTPVVGDTARRVRVVVGELAGVHRFRIQSCRVAGGGRWTDHATGTFRPGKAVAPPDPVHLAERLATETEFSLAGWMHFGPRWSSTVATSGHATEALARLVLPERFRGDLADHPVHPALLDVAAGVLTDVEPGHEYAPFMYRRITVFQPLTADVTVHAWFLESAGRGRRPVSFDIIDTASHTLLLRAESFVTREVLDGFDPTAEPEPHANGARATSPRPAVPAPRPDLDGAPAWLLRPEDGAAAFLDSLCPGRPPVVLVDLPARPLEVPGIPWTDPPRGHPQPVHSGRQEPAPTIPAPAAAPHRDRVEAPAVAAVPPVAASPAVAPGADDDEVLSELRRLWGDALGLTELGVDDDFFELGGDSLGAVQVAARISARFGVEVSAGSLFDTPTLRTLTAEVRSLTGALPVGGAR